MAQAQHLHLCQQLTCVNASMLYRGCWLKHMNLWHGGVYFAMTVIF
jgi:hypothetical protein